MKCPTCGSENGADARFCGQCATPLAADVPCPGCGAVNPMTNRFCESCGQPLAQSSMPGVRRLPERSVERMLSGGRYELRDFLGEGGRKRVYLAHDTRLARDVAIALIKTEGLDETGYARARREAEAMGRLGDHPNIVTIYDIGEDQGRLYIVSQYMAGGDLADLLHSAPERRLPWERAVELTKQVCEALDYAHAHGVVHRDLKPKNVWLTVDGTAKLGDFGLAVALDHSRITLEGMLVGTVAYMPPEQGMGLQSDARSDLYSLGVMLYELVCGRPPFVGDDAVAVVSQHINTAPVAPSWHDPSVPRALEELILKLLSKSPDERPRSAAEVCQTLELLTSGELQVSPPVVHDRANPLDRMASGIFVGRERETEELRSSLEAVLSGRGRVVLVAGEMGIGKTRLAAELGTYAGLRGAQVLWGRCYEGEGAPAYWPWVQVVRSYVSTHDPKIVAQHMGPGALDVAQVVPEVREHLPGLPAPAAPVEGENARFRLFDAVTSFLKSASQDDPLLVILDDLQWADRASLLLLQFLAGELAGSRILLVGTYRDVEVSEDHALSDVLATLRRARDHKRVLLRGLSLEEVTSLLEAVAEHDLGEREKRMIGRIYAQSEGNPFFVEEIIRHLVEGDQLRRTEGRWAITESAENIGIPEGVRETIGRRVARLSDPCRDVLSIAAVVGREFGVDQLELVTNQSPASLLAVLDEAVAARIVLEDPAAVGRYRFAHGLTRETLYQRLSTTRRVSYHAQITEAIEHRHAASIEAHLPELAYHANEAILVSGADKAVDYAVRAARQSVDRFAYEDAVKYYERALEALEHVEGPDTAARTAGVQVALGDAQWRAMEFERARGTFLAAAETAERIGSAETLAAAALGFSSPIGFEIGVRDDILIDLLGRAQQALGDEHPALQARVTARLAEALTFVEGLERRTALGDEALTLARLEGDPWVLARVLGNVQVAIAHQSNLGRRLEMAEEVLALAEATGDERIAMEGHFWRLTNLLELGDLHGVERAFTAWSALAAHLQDRYHVWFVAVYRAMRAIMDGRLDEAEELAAKAYTAGQGLENDNAVQFFGAQVGITRREQGRAGELLDGVRRFAEQYPVHNAWLTYESVVLSEAGRRDEASAIFERFAADDFAGLQQDLLTMHRLVMLSETCCILGDTARAKVLYDMLVPYADQWIVLTWVSLTYAPAHRWLGMLATLAGDFDSAEQHCAAALAAVSQFEGCRLLRVNCLHAYAEMLLRRGEPGDRERARAFINEGMAIARETGAGRMTQRLLALRFADQGIVVSDPDQSILVVAASVEATRPDLRVHAAPDGTVTILFTDIEGSTELNERLGDESWLELLHEHNALVRHAVQEHGGYEVKSQGDGFMIAFSSARDALRCATAVQQALAGYAERNPEQAVRVRIGVHTGEVLKDSDDFFGRNVVLASRIGAAARGGEILVSSVLRSLVEGTGNWTFEDERDLELKGLAGTHRVYTLRTEPATAGA